MLPRVIVFTENECYFEQLNFRSKFSCMPLRGKLLMCLPPNTNTEFCCTPQQNIRKRYFSISNKLLGSDPDVLPDVQVNYPPSPERCDPSESSSEILSAAVQIEFNFTDYAMCVESDFLYKLPSTGLEVQTGPCRRRNFSTAPIEQKISQTAIARKLSAA